MAQGGGGALQRHFPTLAVCEPGMLVSELLDAFGRRRSATSPNGSATHFGSSTAAKPYNAVKRMGSGPLAQMDELCTCFVNGVDVPLTLRVVFFPQPGTLKNCPSYGGGDP